MGMAFRLIVIVIMIVVTTSALRMIMPATLRLSPHLPVENPQHSKDQPAHQHLDAESPLSDQVAVDAAAGIKPNHHHCPDQEDPQLQEQQKALRPFNFTRRVGDGFMAVLMTMRMVVMIMFTATVRPMGVTGRFMAVIGRGVGSSTHDLNQARDCSHGQIASMPKPAA